MKILFIGNIGNKYDAKRFYLSERRIYNGLVRNGHNVWMFGDREELRALTPFGLRAIGKNRVNQKLLKTVSNFLPDAIFLLNADLISSETLATIKTIFPAVRIAQITYDPVFSIKTQKRLKKYIETVDCHFFTSGGEALKPYSYQKRPCYFIPNMTDKAIDTGRAFELTDPRHQVTYVSGHTKDRQEYEDLLLDIKAKRPQFNFSYWGFAHNPTIRGSGYIDLLSDTAIGLNISRTQCGRIKSTPETRYLYSSDRIAQLMGNGCLTFIETGFGLEDLFTADEAVFFKKDADDLLAKIDYYLENPQERMRIAKNGWEKSHHHFSTDKVCQYMVERLFDLPLSQDYAWPTIAVTR